MNRSYLFQCALASVCLGGAARAAEPVDEVHTNALVPSPGTPYTGVPTPPPGLGVSAGATPASAIFCGNVRKYVNDGTGPTNGTANFGGGDPVISQDPSTGLAQCRGHDDAHVLATERAEIRGWIVADGSFVQIAGEEEFSFNVQLDIGWTTQAPVVRAINSLSELSHFILPDNIIGTKSQPNGPAGSAWGGAGGANVHVEVDGWGSARGCGTQGSGWCQYYADKKPADWNDCHGANVESSIPWNAPVCYPFAVSPQLFHAGAYVRLVGTLWEDGAHINGCSLIGHIFNPSHYDCPPSNQAKQCWSAAAPFGRGYTEMHPVDFAEFLPPPPFPHNVLAYALCTSGGDATSVQDSATPLFAKPVNRSVLSTDELVDWNFTNAISLTPSPRFVIGPYQTNFNFGVNSTNSYGLIKSVYDVNWSCSPQCQGRCGGDDGCGTGGICPGVGLTYCPGTARCTSSCCTTCGPQTCGGSDGCGGTCPGAGLTYFPLTDACSATCGPPPFDCSNCDCGCTGTRCVVCPPPPKCNPKLGCSGSSEQPLDGGTP